MIYLGDKKNPWSCQFVKLIVYPVLSCDLMYYVGFYHGTKAHYRESSLMESSSNDHSSLPWHNCWALHHCGIYTTLHYVASTLTFDL